MKKYLADVLTALRAVAVVVLTIMTFAHTAPEWVLLVFVLGELTDAFDGIAARRWPFPQDKIPAYRKYAETYDKITDLALGIITVIYVIVWITNWILYLVVILALSVSGFIDICVYGTLLGGPSNYAPGSLWEKNPSLAKHIILARRYIYIGLIAMMIIILICEANFPFLLKVVLLIAGSLIGLALFIIKKNRRTEV